MSIKNAVVDAGNNMFANGQTYVALSRVTSIEGLHLINFDPSSIKVNDQVLQEYNRLKYKYRPDLPLIHVKQNNFNKVADNKWIMNKEFIKCQNSINLTKN